MESWKLSLLVRGFRINSFLLPFPPAYSSPVQLSLTSPGGGGVGESSQLKKKELGGGVGQLEAGKGEECLFLSAASPGVCKPSAIHIATHLGGREAGVGWGGVVWGEEPVAG